MGVDSANNGRLKLPRLSLTLLTVPYWNAILNHLETYWNYLIDDFNNHNGEITGETIKSPRYYKDNLLPPSFNWPNQTQEEEELEATYTDASGWVSLPDQTPYKYVPVLAGEDLKFAEDVEYGVKLYPIDLPMKTLPQNKGATSLGRQKPFSLYLSRTKKPYEFTSGDFVSMLSVLLTLTSDVENHIITEVTSDPAMIERLSDLVNQEIEAIKKILVERIRQFTIDIWYPLFDSAETPDDAPTPVISPTTATFDTMYPEQEFYISNFQSFPYKVLFTGSSNGKIGENDLIYPHNLFLTPSFTIRVKHPMAYDDTLNFTLSYDGITDEATNILSFSITYKKQA